MNENKKLFVQLYHIHGLFRGNNLELGRDADTGGQTKYVLELATYLSKLDQISEVEVVTRYINDKAVSPDYAVKEEVVNPKLKIIRLRCGGSKYIKKELLWDHLEEFVDKSIKYLKSKGKLPDIIHSHYADAGYVCKELTRFFGIPFVHTGHSLGRSKLNNLLKDGLKIEDIDKKYKINRRIRVEEDVIFYTDRIITSTNQEISHQYGLYETSGEGKFVVIPPSINNEKFHAYNEKREWDEKESEVRNSIRESLWRFFTNINKPTILSICRPEKRKNITGLIKAYGENKELQKKANLAIFAGIRKDITKLPDIEREVLTDILLLMDKYNLYGKMAVPKKHNVEFEIPELYRMTAESGGVFVNSAFNEPFGLTLIEAASSGVPVVATNDGGPKDITKNLDNGILVDVTDTDSISKAINKILDDEKIWRKYSQNGIEKIKEFYTWEAHVKQYFETIQDLYMNSKSNPKTFIRTGKKLFNFGKLIILDIDDTITGDTESMNKLRDILLNLNDKTGFGVATGRTVDSALEKLKEINFKLPDFIISSVGSEIYYNKSDGSYVYSTGWDQHISAQWKKDKIAGIIKNYKNLTLQPEENQRKFKLSYDLIKDKAKLDEIHKSLSDENIKANLIFSHNAYLDILPYRASKGKAVRYISYRWNIPYDKIFVAGDSGNDEDMLTGELLGTIVANHDDELEKLKGRRRVYFAENKHAEGVIEGLKYYRFLED